MLAVIWKHNITFSILKKYLYKTKRQKHPQTCIDPNSAAILDRASLPYKHIQVKGDLRFFWIKYTIIYISQFLVSMDYNLHLYSNKFDVQRKSKSDLSKSS